jgi:hypothetical protein
MADLTTNQYHPASNGNGAVPGMFEAAETNRLEEALRGDKQETESLVELRLRRSVLKPWGHCFLLDILGLFVSPRIISIITQCA